MKSGTPGAGFFYYVNIYSEVKKHCLTLIEFHTNTHTDEANHYTADNNKFIYLQLYHKGAARR